jgi:hypothetical protein
MFNKVNSTLSDMNTMTTYGNGNYFHMAGVINMNGSRTIAYNSMRPDSSCHAESTLLDKLVSRRKGRSEQH